MLNGGNQLNARKHNVKQLVFSVHVLLLPTLDLPVFHELNGIVLYVERKRELLYRQLLYIIESADRKRIGALFVLLVYGYE